MPPSCSLPLFLPCLCPFLRILFIWLLGSDILCGKMAKCSKKVGILGKYGTHYGASLRKMVKKVGISQHAKYTCSFCGKTAMKRRAVGTWHCGSCVGTAAGGAWASGTPLLWQSRLP